MAEHVASSILGFVRAVIEAAPFELRATQTPYSFALQPADNIDGTYRLVPLSYRSVGAFDFAETRYDSFDLYTARWHGGDQAAAMDAAATQAHSLVAAVAREGVVQDFELLDEGRGFEVSTDPSQSYVIARITLPLSYAAQL